MDTDMLKSIATKVVRGFSYEKDLSEYEIEQRELAFGQMKAKYDAIEAEFKEVADTYKARMKPLQKDMEHMSNIVRSGKEWVDEDCYLVIDPSEAKASYYNIDGKCVYVRDASESELEGPPNIFQMRKHG